MRFHKATQFANWHTHLVNLNSQRTEISKKSLKVETLTNSLGTYVNELFPQWKITCFYLSLIFDPLFKPQCRLEMNK